MKYYEFTDQTCLGICRISIPLVVLRTFSKALPFCSRLGYVVAKED